MTNTPIGYLRRKRFLPHERLAIFRQTQGRCGYCGVTLGDKWQIDHMRPLACGGTNDLVNLIAACPPCNNLKHCDTLEEYRHRIENQIPRLHMNSVNFRTALRFGLVQETQVPVKFYFEGQS